MKTSPERTLHRAPALLLLGLLSAVAVQAAEPAAHVNALFRVLKPDGTTVLGQAVVTPGSTAMTTINVNQKDALAAANGRCAFNVKYDEVATAALKGSVNKLFSNDTLVAQNSGIDLQPGVLRTIWTQPYLFAGQNNVKVMLDAASAKPGIAWVRINVDGECKSLTAPPPSTAASTPKVSPPTAAPPVTPTSAGWNALYNAWGYSNYATTQLKTKGYARYADLVKLNADLTAVVNAKQVSQADYEALMARVNSFANDPAFKALMAAVVPSTGKV